jgi:hypothetical protein
MLLILKMVTWQHPTPRSLSPPDKLWANIFCYTAVVLYKEDPVIYEVNNTTNFSFCNTVIRKLPNIMKQLLQVFFWGGGGVNKFKNADHSLPCLCKLPIHTSHVDPGIQTICDVFTCCAPTVNKTQCQDIFSIWEQLCAPVLAWTGH